MPRRGANEFDVLRAKIRLDLRKISEYNVKVSQCYEMFVSSVQPSQRQFSEVKSENKNFCCDSVGTIREQQNKVEIYIGKRQLSAVK